MKKYELLKSLKELKDYLAYTQNYALNMSLEELHDSVRNDSYITQLLVDLSCMAARIAYDMGAGNHE